MKLPERIETERVILKMPSHTGAVGMVSVID